MPDICRTFPYKKADEGMDIMTHRKPVRRKRVRRKNKDDWSTQVDEGLKDWMQHHNIQDMADMVLEMASDGEDVSNESTLLLEFAEVAAKTGGIPQTLRTYSEYDDLYSEIARDMAAA